MTDSSPAKFKKLLTLLRELFQLDQPDLDFGIYRIMHAKAGEVTQFLERDLLPQVKDAFSQYQSADSAELKRKLDQMVAQLTEAGVDPDTAPKVRELREQMKGAIDIGALENEVYDHLYSFFRRYYSEGDFLAKRVYKPGVYAIPYEGEEVTLHWANKDQYYIKTSEYLRDYSFRLRPEAAEGQDPMRVHFRLVDAAEGEHGNVKAAEGKDRVFVLAKEDFIGLGNGELDIRFEYRPATLEDWPEGDRAGKKKPPAQKELTALAVERILASPPLPPAGEGRGEGVLTDWLAELKRPHVKSDGEQADYTRLEAHLRRYTARNTFDYFIHKDLGGFLRRELDFYIKNEVMHLDDVENETAPKVEQYLSKIKVIRRIAGKVIDFLAQLENFQKKLWLKKKFVVDSNWLVSISQVPAELMPEVCANTAQLSEWKTLLSLHELPADVTLPAYSEPLTPAFLKAHPTLLVDTRHFDSDFGARLLEAVGDLDYKSDFILLHSENFQALSLLSARYRRRVKCVYIDPPYNTGGDGFSYRDNYQHSSWMSMLTDRACLLHSLLRSDGAFFCSIDDREALQLRWALDDEFGRSAFVSDISVVNNWKGRQDRDHIATAHEHLLLYQMPEFESLGFPLSEAQIADYDQEDSEGERYQLRDLRKRGGADTRERRANLFFPVYWDPVNRKAGLNRRALTDIEIFPVKSDGVDGCWRWKADTVRDNIDIIEARQVEETGRWNVFYRVYLEHDGETRTAKPKSVWAGTKYSSDRAIKTLKSLLPTTSFKSPKAVGFVEDILLHATCDDELAIDVFAGSGTILHSTISANRSDRGERRAIAVEQGSEFEAVVVPRLKKVAFTPEWKDGKPRRLATSVEAEHSPRLTKVLRLESYEDTLNNITLSRSTQQQAALDFNAARSGDSLREQYLLRYLLAVESRDSASLLKVRAFSDPTAYKLKVKTPGSDESREVNVDLLETFNWLLGLTVQQITAPRSFRAEFERDEERRLQLKGRLRQADDGPFWFRTVTGTTPEGRKTLVIWRKLTGEPEQDNLVLEEWFKNKQAYSVRDAEFDLICVNGDNTLENLRVDPETWKVRLIEEDFHRLMFEGTEG